MNVLELLQKELEAEYRTTQKFLEIYPEQKNDYAPHPKSMKLGHLATHITAILSWPGFMLDTESLDQSKAPVPDIFSTPAEFLEKAEKNYQYSMNALKKATEADLDKSWALKNGDQVLSEWNKYGAIRHALNQITHHRAQLGVYYRLNDLSLPNSYGPTADIKGFGA